MDTGMHRSQEPGEFYIPAGVGPHPLPHPTGPEFDPDLLLNGDSRNIVDEFRYLTVEAIRERLAARRIPLEIAIENWQHDLNIGSLVRTANAFNVHRFHVIGKKHWNKHGALMTDKYIDVVNHADVAAFANDCASRDIEIIGVDNVEGSQSLETSSLPAACVLLFGNEGLGLSPEALAASQRLLAISQTGSVRSINASAAGAMAIYHWHLQHSS